MIASAMAVYGKVSESQAKSIAAKAIGAHESAENNIMTAKEANAVVNEVPEGDVEFTEQTEAQEAEPKLQSEVAQSVLESFGQASQRKN